MARSMKRLKTITDRSVGNRKCYLAEPDRVNWIPWRISKLEVGATGGVRTAVGSGCRKQAFLNAMQALPCRFGEGGVGTDDVADHLPGGQVERAFGSGTHRQRNRALRAETDALGCGFLARPYPNGLRKEIHGDRLLSGFEFSAAAKTI